MSSVGKAHGRIETRRCRLSTVVDWMSGHRRYPGEPRFKGLAAIAVIDTTSESNGHTAVERRCFVSSAKLDARRFATAVRNHWRIENGLHWVLDVTFKEDQSRLRKGHGAKNMAIVRHFALNLVRTAQGPKSIKGRRKLAGWDTAYLQSILTAQAR